MIDFIPLIVINHICKIFFKLKIYLIFRFLYNKYAGMKYKEY